jgi:hypothetical protein
LRSTIRIEEKRRERKSRGIETMRNKDIEGRNITE